MSLVGNLEDLSLGDIMQIISLSQKSGVLALEGDASSGRIVFRSGLVHAASMKGRPDDLSGLLVEGGVAEGAAFDALVARARELGLSIEEAIAQERDLSSERIDELLRESVEAVILEMFSWVSGDFSFDVRIEREPDDPQLVLSSGINAQFLAMEGMRVCDERSRNLAEEPVDPNAITASADTFPPVEAMFGDEPLETEALLSSDADDLAELEVDDDLSAADILVETVVAREDAPTGFDASAMSVILIASDVSVLEWVKTTIQDGFARVHIFQQAELGLARIRQYLIRGELPVVLISTDIRIDPLSGIHGLSDFVERLKTQASRLVIVGLQEDGDGAKPASTIAFDSVLPRPSRSQLRERGGNFDSASAEELSAALHQILAGRDASGRSSSTKL